MHNKNPMINRQDKYIRLLALAIIEGDQEKAKSVLAEIDQDISSRRSISMLVLGVLIALFVFKLISWISSIKF